MPGGEKFDMCSRLYTPSVSWKKDRQYFGNNFNKFFIFVMDQRMILILQVMKTQKPTAAGSGNTYRNSSHQLWPPYSLDLNAVDCLKIGEGYITRIADLHDQKSYKHWVGQAGSRCRHGFTQSWRHRLTMADPRGGARGRSPPPPRLGPKKIHSAT